MQTRLLIEIAIYPFDYRKNKGRSTWLDIDSRENRGTKKSRSRCHRGCSEHFVNWARENKPPFGANRDDPDCWEIALLSPYQAQRRGLRDMVRKLTGLRFETRFDLRQMKSLQ